jgi:multimeric flavodoxin WrbA
MRITLLNGEPHAHSEFDLYLADLTSRLAARERIITKLDLRDLDLKGCSGCFGCWVKTPGECVKRDQSTQVCRAIVNSDLLLLASPITMGFTSSLLKRAIDQSISLLHPYIVVEGGEMHHRPRYAHYPEFALLLSAGNDTDAEDIEITTAIWRRTARNLKLRLVFTAVADRSAEEVADEIALVA